MSREKPGLISRANDKYTCPNFRSIYLKQWNVNNWDSILTGFWLRCQRRIIGRKMVNTFVLVYASRLKEG